MRDKNKPTVYRVGYFGDGIYKANIKGVQTKRYKIWNSMLQRCYDVKFQSRNPWYKDCKVDEKWHNYQNFAKWFEDNYIKGFELDKDLINKNNKIYSSINCSFIPKQINNLLIKRGKLRGIYPLGVTRLRDKFMSQLSVNGKLVKLGIFNSVEEAFKVYKKEKEQLIKKMAEEYKKDIPQIIYENLVNYKITIND